MDKTKIITTTVGTPEYSCNLMPCRIKYTGVVKNDFEEDKNYWKVTQSNGDKVKTYFRGRELNGTQVDLASKNYKGIVISKNDQDDVYETVGSFNTLNNFYNGNDQNNYDELIDEWLHVSKILN